MKRLLIILLSMIILLSSCMIEDPVDTEHGFSSDQSQENSSFETEADTSLESESEPSYSDIERYSPKGYSQKHFGIDGSNYVFSFDMATEWQISKVSNSEYTISRAKNNIGYVISKPLSDTESWKSLSIKQKTIDILTAEERIEKKGSGKDVEYRYVWKYSYYEAGKYYELNVIVTCAEVPTLATYYMLSKVKHRVLKTEPNLNVLSSLKDSKSFLILGNSFVGTSKVGVALNDMMLANNKGCEVVGTSIGMGNIGKYATDEQILESIRDGAYDALFISGFYTQDDAYSLSIFKEACDASGTTLVVFPAHNENNLSARMSAIKCGVQIINWQSEIDTIISGGVDKSYMCIDDSYSHSTPLAGYVGAHMIYRAIYGESPECNVSTVTQSEIARLGEYAQTGIAYTVPPRQIYHLK